MASGKDVVLHYVVVAWWRPAFNVHRDNGILLPLPDDFVLVMSPLRRSSTRNIRRPIRYHGSFINTGKMKNVDVTKLLSNPFTLLESAWGNGEIRIGGEREEYEGSNEMRMGGEALNGKDGFTGDLNGAQFPPINGMGGNRNEVNEGLKDCLGKENNSNSGNVNTDSVDGTGAMNERNANANSNNDRNKIATNTATKNLVDIVNSSKLDNKLLNVPTGISESGDDVVIFDDELIELGSKKWNLTVCGQFIRCSIGFNEARYHIRRMWSRLGLRDVIAENGVFYFKFQDEEGIKEVINNGPWMVNNKPMVVQKWSIDMCLDKAEPKNIPVRVKMLNVPMEAWSVKGISALVSSIGKPVIMDEVTTKMCVTGVRRIGFARVLVEIDAEKGIKDKIEIMYRSKNVATGTKKIVDVEYSWIPSICS
ncbi:RNA-directed DNA polymerase, eukaryota, reverse transcriptase zinc-binding domain protein [Tanacetum coccineum]